MKPASYGRILFGASAVLFGVIALMWHDADTWQTLHKLWSLPFGTIVGDALMIAQIAAGIGILFPRTVRPASIVLIAVYGLFSLACIPNILAAPARYAPYGSFFEQFCLECGAIVVYAALETSASRRAALGQIARFGLGVCAVSFTLAQLFYLHLTAELVPIWIPPNQMFWAILTTIAFALAAIAILANYCALLSMRLMTLMIVLFGLLVWIPLLAAHPEAHGNWSEFVLTFQIAGAAWVVAELSSLPLESYRLST